MNKPLLLLCVLTLACCSSFKGNTLNEIGEQPYVMPENPFSTVMEQFYSYKLPVYKMEIDPKSVVFDCTKRNDEELYWCGIDAVLKYPDKNLPHNITMLLSFSISGEGVHQYHRAVKRLRRSSLPLFLLGIFPSKIEDEVGGSIVGKYYGIYNEKECLNWYGYFEDCPKSAKAIK